MTMQLTFNEVLHYDPGEPGIALEVKLAITAWGHESTVDIAGIVFNQYLRQIDLR